MKSSAMKLVILFIWLYVYSFRSSNWFRSHTILLLFFQPPTTTPYFRAISRVLHSMMGLEMES